MMDAPVEGPRGRTCAFRGRLLRPGCLWLLVQEQALQYVSKAPPAREYDPSSWQPVKVRPHLLPREGVILCACTSSLLCLGRAVRLVGCLAQGNLQHALQIRRQRLW